MEVAQAAGSLTLLGTALALGFRHGIDWDHIAAITDITTTTTSLESAEPHPPVVSSAILATPTPRHVSIGHLEIRALGLATLYALGHASVVAGLGLLALYF